MGDRTSVTGRKPAVVLDANIATEANIELLCSKSTCAYLVRAQEVQGLYRQQHCSGARKQGASHNLAKIKSG